MNKLWLAERLYGYPDMGFWNDSKLLCAQLKAWREDYKNDPWPDHDGPYPVEQWAENIKITEIDELNKAWLNPVTVDWDGDRVTYDLNEYLEKYDEN